jgi:hypothetical protein
MKFHAVWLLLLSFALAGCESLSDVASGVREKFEVRNEGRTKVFAAPARATYEAVRLAATQMGYRILRAGAAQGNLEAVSGVGQGETNRSSRQVSMKVRVDETEMSGGTEVTVRFTEIIEDDSSNRAGQATETPLRDTPQYEVFFRSVQQALGAVVVGGALCPDFPAFVDCESGRKVPPTGPNSGLRRAAARQTLTVRGC